MSTIVTRFSMQIQLQCQMQALYSCTIDAAPQNDTNIENELVLTLTWLSQKCTSPFNAIIISNYANTRIASNETKLQQNNAIIEVISANTSFSSNNIETFTT